jgi:lipopolysaccharide export LptBFGC system permease protein LptF
MRACGIPAPRALMPVLIAAALMVPLYFTLNDVVVPRANALAHQVKHDEIKEGHSQDKWAVRKEPVWYRAGNKLIEAEIFDPEGGDASMLVIYRTADDGHPVSRIDADSARHIGGGEWRLAGARMIEMTADAVRNVPAPRYAALGEVLPAETSTRQPRWKRTVMMPRRTRSIAR